MSLEKPLEEGSSARPVVPGAQGTGTPVPGSRSGPAGLRAVPGGSPRRPWPGPPGDAADRTTVLVPSRLDRRAAETGLLLVSAPGIDQVGTFYPLESSEVVIGRAAGADIRVDDPGVSRRHVTISRDPSGGFMARDLGTTNGTFLNGASFLSAPLSEGDRLQIGTTVEFRFGVRSEAAQSEVRLRQAISTAGAGTWEWLPASGALQLSGGVVHATRPGAEPTEPRGEDAWSRVHPEERESLRSRLAAALRLGGTFRAEVRLVGRDGRVVWVAMNGEAFRDRAGRTVRLAGALLDITERRHAEVELRRHSLLFDSLADAVVVSGANGTIIDWSAGAVQLLGWSKAEALGRCPGALLLAGDEERLDGALRECLGSGARRSDQLTLRSKSGAEVPVELVAVPLRSQEDDLIACVAVFRDLGERQRLQARLQVAERLASLGTLAAGVAHEINNPLAFVATNLEFIATQLDGAAAALGPAHAGIAAALADSREGAARVSRIVRDMQAFGAEPKGPPAVFDPNVALKFALKMVEGRIASRASLVKDLNPVPGVLGSEARLGQVFINLLVNAAQAVEPGRTDDRVIRVASRFDHASRRVVVEVSDDGPGIPADVLPRIFEPFFTTKSVGEGTGLGLFVCLGIVKDLKGEITVESEVGRGTTFRVLLPAVGSAPRAARPRPRVLVVEDEPLLGVSLKRHFASRYDVEGAADPGQALQRIRSGEAFQFVAADLKVPGMSGPEFMARLRVLSPELARRAVLVTASPLGEAAQAFTDEGRPTLMGKPVDLARLETLVEAAVGRD